MVMALLKLVQRECSWGVGKWELGEEKMEGVPTAVLSEEILGRLDLESLCSMACVNRAFRTSVESQALPSLSSLRLPTISPDGQTLNRILGRCKGLSSLTLSCLRLPDDSLRGFLNPTIRELNLFCCSLLSYQFLVSIGFHCPNLRVLLLEFADKNSPDAFVGSLCRLLIKSLHLESLSLKIRGTEVDASAFKNIVYYFPSTLKKLKLQPVLEDDAIFLARSVGTKLLVIEDFSIRNFSHYCNVKLQSLSLVLDIITDELLITITECLPFLVELDLEDRPNKEPFLHRDLTNTGLQSLGCRHNLTGLSLVRSRLKYQGTFKRINNMGMFLLSEGCKALESVRLCGFSKVSDAGFASILHSCRNLKKFEVRNALLLSDLAFHDLSGVSCALVEVRLLWCRLITSETVKKLTSSRSLEVLDLGGCKSITDACLSSISHLHKLTALNLTGVDVTDSGLSVLGQANLPVTNLCLRGCKRVTDKGVSHLFCGGGTISQSLTALDLGYMPGVSDNAMLTIVAAGTSIIDLCIRSCFCVTDASVEALATRKMCENRGKHLRRLDLCNCIGLSVDSSRWLKRPFFQGLYWIGIGQTRLARQGDAVITEIRKERPWLTLCLDGCEIGCHDGWQFHGPGSL